MVAKKKKKDLSRQREWQLKVREEDRCTQCGAPGLVTLNHCEKCANEQNERGKKRYRENRQIIRELRCGNCGQTGHNRQTCHKNAA